MIDWGSAAAMLIAGAIIGGMFMFSMKRRKETGDAQVRDLEAKRDALVARLREVDLPDAEKHRLELEAAGVLRQLDQRTPAPRAAPAAAAAVGQRRAQLAGFAWGVASMVVIGGLFWYVTKKAEPRNDAATQQAAPMQQPQQTGQPQADPEVQGIEAAVAARPDDLLLRNQL